MRKVNGKHSQDDHSSIQNVCTQSQPPISYTRTQKQIERLDALKYTSVVITLPSHPPASSMVLYTDLQQPTPTSILHETYSTTGNFKPTHRMNKQTVLNPNATHISTTFPVTLSLTCAMDPSTFGGANLRGEFLEYRTKNSMAQAA